MDREQGGRQANFRTQCNVIKRKHVVQLNGVSACGTNIVTVEYSAFHEHSLMQHWERQLQTGALEYQCSLLWLQSLTSEALYVTGTHRMVLI